MKGKEEFELYLRGSMRLRTTDPPMRVRGGKVLASYRHHFHTDWKFILRCDHRGTEVFQWLVAKRILELRFSHTQEVLLFWLAAERPDWTQILLNLNSDSKKMLTSKAFPASRKKIPSELQETARRILRSYEPQIYPYRQFSPTVVLPVRRIGVGYKDKGNLSSAPSWKDQILYSVEETQEGENSNFLHLLLLSLRSIPDIAD